MKFDVAITLYNPECNILDKIKEYERVFDEIYLFDNTENINHMIELNNTSDKIHYFCNGENNGLPYAFNYVLKHLSDETDFLCTMDQDSVFNEKDIVLMKDMLEQNKIDDLGILCPKVIYDYKQYSAKINVKKVKYCICSGSFVNMSVIRNFNIKYDENYFIDRFDIDICQEIVEHGYYIYQYDNAVLYQELGEKSQYKHSNHSVDRHYYIFRNRFYFNNKYIKNKFKKYLLNITQTIKHILLIVLYENKKIKKIKELKYSCIDYKNYHMGKRL